jgi:hypothetical protein
VVRGTRVRVLVKFIEQTLVVFMSLGGTLTLCPYIKTHDCLSLRRDTSSLNDITTGLFL